MCSITGVLDVTFVPVTTERALVHIVFPPSRACWPSYA